MTFQRLCNLVTKGDLNYYSKQFSILIEPLESKSQLSYRLTVLRGKDVLEVVDLEPPLQEIDNGWTADHLRDKILSIKQGLHFKYLLV